MRRARAALALFALLGALAAQATPTVVSGRVVNEKGKPIAGAKVASGNLDDIVTRDALDAPAAVSDADGRFAVAFDGLARRPGEPERTLLVAHPGKMAMRLWLLGDVSGQAPARIDAGAIALAAGVQLNGRVVTPDGKPLADVRVQASDLLRVMNRYPVAGACLMAMTAARTDERGVFRLPCAPPSAAALTFTKEGWFTRQLSPVGIETPVTLTMQPSGFVSGRVVGEDGKGCAMRLQVGYHAGRDGELWSDAAGSFRLPVAFPGRLTIVGNADYDPDHREVAATPLEGPCEGVVLRARRKVKGKAAEVVVRAKDAAGGLPLASFGASPSWITMHPDGKSYGSTPFPAEPVSAAGELRVLLRSPPEATHADVRVSAPGRASVIVRVRLDFEKPVELVRSLGPEAVLEGRIVDARTSQGIAGATCWLGNPAQRVLLSRPPPEARRTGPDGSFRFEGLEPGDHALHVFHPDRPVPVASVFRLEAGKALSARLVRLEKGSALRGKLTGAAVPPGSLVRIAQRAGLQVFQGGEASRYIGLTGHRSSEVKADGTFELWGLDAGPHELELVVQDHRRLGTPQRCTLGSVELAADVEREFSLAGRLPLAVAGTVQLGPAQPLWDRLAVVAEAEPEPPARFERFVTLSRRPAAAAALAPNGRFELRLAPGRWRLRVYDAATGTTLWEGGKLEVASSTELAEQTVSLSLARVVVTLSHAKGERVATSLRVRSAASARDERMGPDQLFLARAEEGLRLEPGQRECELWLPAGDFALCPMWYGQPLTEQAVTVTDAREQRIELAITADAPK